MPKASNGLSAGVVPPPTATGSMFPYILLNRIQSGVCYVFFFIYFCAFVFLGVFIFTIICCDLILKAESAALMRIFIVSRYFQYFALMMQDTPIQTAFFLTQASLGQTGGGIFPDHVTKNEVLQ
jgi:hypothetical protein